MTEIIIQKGDTLSKLAKLYGISTNDIAKANGISDPNKINAGQKIVIPDPAPIKESAGIDSVEIKQNINTTKIKENKFFNSINKYLNIPSENLSIYKDKKGNEYLKISRPENSSDNEKGLYKLGKIKNDLLLKDNVLYNNNGKRQGISKTVGVYDATSVINMDNLSIASGHYIFVPLSEIGQKPEIEEGFFVRTKKDSPKNIELKTIVSDYQN